MSKPRGPIVLAVAVSVFAFTLAFPVTGFLGIAPAFAKDHNGNGNSGGNGNGNGNSGGNASGSTTFASSGLGHSGTAPGRIKSKNVESASTAASEPVVGIAPTGKGQNKVKGDDPQVGALHAVHANLQAFIHASPNSRVGKIAAYAMAAVGVEDATQALADAKAALAEAEAALTDALAAFDTSTDMTAFKLLYSYTDYDLATLQGRYDALSTSVVPLTTEEGNELAALTTVLGSSPATNLGAAIDAIDGADGLAEGVDLAQAELDLAEQAATNALATAGNKPITPEVKVYVDGQLEAGGILEYFRTQ